MLTVDDAPSNDLAGIRTVTLSNGSKLHMKREDTFNFWTINYDKGQVPESLSGRYTSMDEALRGINIYLENKDLTIVETVLTKPTLTSASKAEVEKEVLTLPASAFSKK